MKLKQANFSFLACLLVAPLLAIFFVGCSVAMKFDVSVPEEIPPGITGNITDGILEVERAGLTVSIQMQNFRYTGSSRFSPIPILPIPLIPLSEKEDEIKGPLVIWLAVTKPKSAVTGAAAPVDEPLSFDPGRVFLGTEEKARFAPSVFIGPGNPWASPRASGMGCGRRFGVGPGIVTSVVDHQKDGAKAPAGPVPFQTPSCFVLWFETEPSPERGFKLAVEGLIRAGEPVPIPEFHFTKGSVWRYFVAP